MCGRNVSVHIRVTEFEFILIKNNKNNKQNKTFQSNVDAKKHHKPHVRWIHTARIQPGFLLDPVMDVTSKRTREKFSIFTWHS